MKTGHTTQKTRTYDEYVNLESDKIKLNREIVGLDMGMGVLMWRTERREEAKHSWGLSIE